MGQRCSSLELTGSPDFTVLQGGPVKQGWGAAGGFSESEQLTLRSSSGTPLTPPKVKTLVKLT